MQEKEALQILERMGGAPTPRNLQMIMQQAPNESALLGKSLGLQGGEGQGQDTNILDKLDKLDANSSRSPAALVAPEVSSGMTYSAPAAAAARVPVPANDGISPIGVIGPTRKAAPNPVLAGGAPIDPNADATTVNPIGGPGLLTALASILGLTSTAGRNIMNKTGNDAFPRDVVPKTAVEAEAASLDPTRKAASSSDPIDRNVAADTINEQRRPTNTYADERASDVKNKPVNMRTPRKPVPDDSIPTNLTPLRDDGLSMEDLVGAVAKTGKRLKGVR